MKKYAYIYDMSYIVLIKIYLSYNLEDLASVEKIDIKYVVLQTSCYTTSQLKAFKSLDATNILFRLGQRFRIQRSFKWGATSFCPDE